jgi:hypothetical protein
MPYKIAFVNGFADVNCCIITARRPILLRDAYAWADGMPDESIGEEGRSGGSLRLHVYRGHAKNDDSERETLQKSKIKLVNRLSERD